VPQLRENKMTTTYLLTSLEALPAIICGLGLLCGYWLVMKARRSKQDSSDVRDWRIKTPKRFDTNE
jgi:hypothetical protein